MSQSHWTVRSFWALVSLEPLSARTSIKACASVAAWLGVGSLVSILLAPLSESERTNSYIGLGIAIVVLSGAALSWYRSEVERPYLFMMGVSLVSAVAWYSHFMYQALSAPRGANVRFAHAPGVLALALAFGVRIVIEAWQDRQDGSLLAQRASTAALAIGGALDLFVITQMFSRF